MKIRARYLLLVAMIVSAETIVPAHGQALPDLPAYQPGPPLSGTIRSWGHGFLKVMLKDWESGFQKYYPEVHFEDTLLSSASAIAGLYAGRADLGVLAREITPPELAAYEKVGGQPVFAVDVLTGSYGNPDKIMTLGVFVNTENPITQLSFSQLDAIFGSERRRGEPKIIRTWGEAGGEDIKWKDKTIKPYSGLAFEAPGYFFSQKVLGGSVLWNCNLQQLDDLPIAGGKTIDGYQRVVDAAGSDRYGIAIAGAGYTNPHAKLVALAFSDGGPFIEPTRENVQKRSYPLARPVRFYINSGSKLPANPLVLEFLRFVLSREGQQQVLKEGEFFPLTRDVLDRERAHLATAR